MASSIILGLWSQQVYGGFTGGHGQPVSTIVDRSGERAREMNMEIDVEGP